MRSDHPRSRKSEFAQERKFVSIVDARRGIWRVPSAKSLLELQAPFAAPTPAPTFTCNPFAHFPPLHYELARYQYG